MYVGYAHLDIGELEIMKAGQKEAAKVMNLNHADQVKAYIRSGDYIELWALNERAIEKSFRGWRGE